MSTIYALSTPPGKSGIAVIRVSGAHAKGVCAALHFPLPAPRLATLAELKASDGIVIDRALVLYFQAPHSFTGEDSVEMHVHGSRAVIKQLLDTLALVPGLRAAEPGEFARRAFLNGKMDLTAAEGLADLIDAETEAQRKQALRLMQGDAAVFYDDLRASVLHALAYLEAYIDFPDEEIPAHVITEINAEIQDIIKNIDQQLADNQAAEKIRDGIYVTILGAPNVGKSSLMNLLAKRDVAIVSSHAGTTRDVIEVHLDIRGYSVILSDTAGIRDHADEIEQEGIRRSFERARTADIKIILLDKESVAKNDLVALVDAQTILLFSKADLGLPSPLPTISGKMPVPISVANNSGIDAFMRELESRITSLEPTEPSFITRSRHRQHLTQARAHLIKCDINGPMPIELCCEELRRAATEVGKITGKIAVDELLGHIFASFCIGK